MVRPILDPVSEAIFRELERRHPNRPELQWAVMVEACDMSVKRFKAIRQGVSWMSARELGFTLDYLGFKLLAPRPEDIDPRDLLICDEKMPLEEIKRRAERAAQLKRRYFGTTQQRRNMQIDLDGEGGALPVVTDEGPRDGPQPQ